MLLCWRLETHLLLLFVNHLFHGVSQHLNLFVHSLLLDCRLILLLVFDNDLLLFELFTF